MQFLANSVEYLLSPEVLLEFTYIQNVSILSFGTSRIGRVAPSVISISEYLSEIRHYSQIYGSKQGSLFTVSINNILL